ncbi:ABC transporter substrate-binding protein [Saliniramus sp.]|uniref:ABC transporter substrate-binding protein n=1 Tax=Saliniramus sp. TaxID=2986772 RepID=UPI002CC9640E|nr:ABC transporter substrate-binding protein [Saliniramus sp.]HMB09294.1 ABC transporter substrate-binding protein [Saliniramus sp.]
MSGIGKGIAAIGAAIVLASGASAQESVRVGVVQGLSGPPAIVDFGESYLQGIRLALKDYEASDAQTGIELIVYDDEANPQRAVSVIQRLIQNDGVSAVMGTVSSGNVLAFAPVLQRAGIPLIAGPSIATNITAQFIDEDPSYIFRCSMVERYQIDAMLDWAVENFDNVGLVHSTTGYGNFAAEEIRNGMAARDRELAAVEGAAPGVNDLTPQMIRMRDADAQLVLNFHESFELIYRPMARLDYRPVIAGNWGLSSLNVLEIVGLDAIEGTVMGQALDLADPKAQAFDARMRDEYGTSYRWPVVAALGYDAGQIMFEAVNRVGRSDPAAIRDAIENIDGVDAISATPSEPFGPDNHECLNPEHVFLGVWRDGDVVRLQ